MINNKILDQLSAITAEERKILNGNETIDRGLYMTTENNVINSKKLLDEGKLITIRPHTRFIHFPKHTHDYIEVVYMCKGETIHIVNNSEIRLCEGELLFLGKKSTHEIMKAGKDDIAVNFIILPQFFDTTLKMIEDEESPLRRFILGALKSESDSPGYLYFKVSTVLPVQNLVENLLYTLISNTSNKRRINQTTMGLLILQLLNCTDKLSHENKHDAFLSDVFRYIEENYCEGSLSDLANTLHYDLFRLSREIKARTGKTYTELLQEKRLSQAAFLLKNTNLKISDISSSIGYENESYFHRIFVSHFGLTPKKFRDCK